MSRGRLFVWLQYLLPQHTLSRLVLRATRIRATGFKNWLIKGFLKLYSVDMDDAVQTDPLSFGSFNEFFTRALRPEKRPFAPQSNAILCPVDGTVSEAGRIDSDSLLQAKGQHYSLSGLLAAQPWAGHFEGGSFATIYLAPFNYHRIHIPLEGRLLNTVFVPGRLFSVNSITAQYVPRLFARNERVLTHFDSAHGEFALVLVGALNVGSIATVWAGDIAPAPRREISVLAPQAVVLARGAELGRFNMGSTVILLFQAGRAQWLPEVKAGLSVRLGQSLGTLH
jgi:phosphatidylserine decarboxylase